MDDTGADSVLHALLGQRPGYAKEEAPEHFRHKNKHAIVYEDDDVVAIDQCVTEHEDGSAPHLWKQRVILAPRKHVESLLDLDVGDEHLALALLRGIQKVALRMGFEKQGFEIAIDVLPPEQHASLLKIKIRSGETDPITPSGM